MPASDRSRVGHRIYLAYAWGRTQGVAGVLLSRMLKWKTSKKQGYQRHTRISDFGQAPSHVDGPTAQPLA